MDEFQTPPEEYIKDFNRGYLISKENPEIAEIINKSLEKSSLGSGFSDGRKQYIHEMENEKLPSWLRKDRLSQDINKQDSKGRGLDRD